MNIINPFLYKLILQISLIWFDKANPNKANNLQIDPNLPATLPSGLTFSTPMVKLHPLDPFWKASHSGSFSLPLILNNNEDNDNET